MTTFSALSISTSCSRSSLPALLTIMWAEGTTATPVTTIRFRSSLSSCLISVQTVAGLAGGSTCSSPSMRHRALRSPKRFARGTFFDVAALHLVTLATLRRLGELQSTSRFEVARYRPNVVLDGDVPPFGENEWTGTTVRLARR